MLTRTALFLLTLSATATAQARHTVTHEDIWLMKRVGAPTASPDGHWAVFSVTDPSYDPGRQTSDLWIVPMDGSAQPRRITNTKGGESDVAWSADSKRIAFVAQREGDDVSQIYLLDVANGGEATRVTSLSTGATAPRWSPDGRSLLFTSMIYPGARTDSANKAAAAERRERKYNARVFESSPIRLWDHWLDERRPSLFVQSLDSGAAARDILAGSQLVTGAGYGGQLGGSGESLAATWTPDGNGVVFAATTNRNQWTYGDVNQSLWFVSVAGGEPRRLTATNADFGSPRFTPDGRSLVAEMTPSDEKTAHNTRLVIWTWTPERLGGQRTIAGGTTLSAGSWQFSPDGRSVYFLAEQQGHQKLFRSGNGNADAPCEAGGACEVGALRAGTYTSVSVTGPASAPTIVASWESAVNPPEVVRVSPTNGAQTRLTSFNVARAASIDWQPLREFWFTSSKGKRLHSFIALPPAFDSTKKYPLFVLIHGGAANMWTDAFGLRWNYHLLGAPGYVMLMTDYTGSTGYGEKFTQDIQFDPLKGPGAELNEAADEAIRRYAFIDGSKQIAGGASYGGHLTNWLAATTTRYKALVSHAGLWDLESQWGTSDFNYDRERNIGSPPWMMDSLWRTQSPMRYAANLRTPTLVSVGERDFRVPMNNALEFWTALQRQRVPSKLIVWPTENHWILNGENSRFFYKEVRDWMQRWLREPTATSTQ
jgi:dipeptidyl aminopeptidase/acylaminoacyl peptidase